jgi:hypothetical protein
MYCAGKPRQIGVYEIARKKLKSGPQESTGKSADNLVDAARKAALEGTQQTLK